MTRFYNALTRLRDRNRDEKGFTLIELLIVVLIIGVLAAIAIPIYLSTTATAKENTAKTSVTDAKTSIVAYYTQNGSLPATLAAAGYTPSSDLVFAYKPGTVSGTAAPFCVAAQFNKDGKVFKATDAASTASTADETAAAACP